MMDGKAPLDYEGPRRRKVSTGALIVMLLSFALFVCLLYRLIFRGLL